MELDRRALAQFGPGPLGQFKTNWTVAALDARFAAERASWRAGSSAAVSSEDAAAGKEVSTHGGQAAIYRGRISRLQAE